MGVSDVERFWREILARVSESAELRPGATYRGTLDSQLTGVARDNTLAAMATLAQSTATSRTITSNVTATGATIAQSAPPRTTTPAPPPDPSTPSSSVAGGAYEIVDLVARGGMAVIYRAHQHSLSRDIAIKASTTDDEAKKFVAEALVTARLEHPNVVPVYDLTRTDDGELALAMKLVGGTTWLAFLDGSAREDSKGPRTLEDHLEVLLTVSNAIAFAHSHGIVHLDIKPENVLIGDYGEVLVVDWGLALDFRDAPDEHAIAPPKSALKTPCGTPNYLAPELAAAEVDAIGPRTDVYLLGAVLYHVATGRPPHDGPTVVDAVVSALVNDRPAFRPGDAVPPQLREIIVRAMAREPQDRFASVGELQQALRDYLRHRQSLEIADRARQTLDHCLADRGSVEDRSRLYANFSEAVAGFREAQVLWPENPEAGAGELEARLAFARAAADSGDLGLARSQAEMAIEARGEAAQTQELLARIDAQAAERRRAAQTTRRLRRTAWGAMALLIVGLGTGAWLINAEKERAVASEALAAERLASIQQLSDVKHLSDLQAEAEALWPAVPSRAAALRAWLKAAETLTSRLPGHEKSLAALRAHGVGTPDGVHFDDVALQWEHDTLAGLIAGLRALDTTLRPDVEARLAFAESVEARSIEAHREAWQRTVRGVAASPRYGGLKMTPQLGLVPLGPDPESGLYEFAHLASGDVPTRQRDGSLRITGDSGIVLVLLPGGTFRMGARPPGPDAEEGQPNVDPRAHEREGPVHDVTLAPFFMGKYEVTQGQWERATGHNPAAYLPGKEVGGRVHTLAHPVEQVRWREAVQMATRLDLTLPTEAQWEYATRAGTTTVYWTGDAKETLQGALNIADADCRDHGGPGSWRYEGWLHDGYVAHAPVGSYRANAFGLHDTAGNVWEWCLDRFGAYTLAVADGNGERNAPDDAPRVFRGGGFRASSVHARSAERYSLYGKDYRAYDVGARAARPLRD